MAAYQAPNCDLCAVQHLKSTANIWCPNCEEALCSKCQVQHGIAKTSKAHKTIPIETYEKLPPFVQEIHQECDDHKERYEYFCTRHDAACCVKCLKTSHRGCPETMTLLSEMTDGFKSSKLLTDFEISVKNVAANMKTLFSFQENCLKTLHWQRQICGKKITTKRKEINQKLNEVDQNLRDELSTVFDQNKIKIEEAIGQLKSREKRINENLEVVESIKHHATEYQAYFCIQCLTKEIRKQDEFLQSLVDSANRIEHIDLDVQLDDNFDIDTHSCFGKVQVTTVLTELDLERQNLEAQMSSGVNEIEIDGIRLKRRYYFDLCLETYYQKSHVFCCTSTKEGNLVFSVPPKTYLLVYNKHGKHLRDIYLTYPAMGIAILNNNVVVAYDVIKEVHLLDLSSSQVVLKIPCESVPHSLFVMENNNILIGMQGCGYKIYDQNQVHTSQCIPMNLVSPHFMVAYGDKVFYTDWTRNTIVSTDLLGKSGAQHSTTILKNPTGITVNENGLLYVSGFNSGNVIVLAQDGTCKEVISASEGIEKPRCLHYILNEKLLVIASEDGKVYVYEEM